jgi:hypothetical protein
LEGNVTPQDLEKLITVYQHDVQTFGGLAREAQQTADRYRNFARESAAAVARLVAQRTPETVARMEQERGLA